MKNLTLYSSCMQFEIMFWDKIQKDLEEKFKRDFTWSESKVITTASSEVFNNETILNNWNNNKSILNNIEIVFYTDSDIEIYLKNTSLYLYEIYKMINPVHGAMKADYFRYIIIYIEGGLYLDVKSGVTENLFLQLDENVTQYLAHWYLPKHNGWGIHKELNYMPEFLNWFILSKPGNRNLLEVIKKMIFNIMNYSIILHGVGGIAVWKTTGPIVYSKVLSNSKIINYKVINYNELGLFYSCFEEQRLNTNHRSIVKHYYQNSQQRIVFGNWVSRYVKLVIIKISTMKLKF
jgi:inositol phosphorylceramide mannosyltransferase catalytic subunit